MATDRRRTLIAGGATTRSSHPRDRGAAPSVPTQRPAPQPVDEDGVPGFSELLRGLPKPGMAIAAALIVVAVFIVANGLSGDNSTAPAATTTTALLASTTTTTEPTATTTTAPASTWLDGSRPVLVSPAPTGATKFGKTWAAPAGTLLTAPATVWGDKAKVGSYRWDRCDPGQQNCEPIKGANKAKYRVPKLPARTELRVVVTLPTKNLTVASAAVVIP